MLKRRIAMATLALIPFTATNAFASNQEGIVTATSLNVRSGPSTDSSFLFSIKKNDKVTILKSENGWYKISTANGHEGWASSEYISTNTSDTNQQSNKKVVNVDNLNMRNGASTSYRVIMKLNKGTVIEIISESNGWTKIKHDGRIGFVASKYLSPIENNNQPTKPEQQPNAPVQPQVSVGKTKVVVATSLNVRSGPSTSNSVVGSLKQNEVVEVISESNGWSKIKYNGKEAYVSSTYLKDYDEDISSGGDSSEVVNGATVNYKYENHSLQDHINKQLSKVNMIASSSGGFINASRSDIEHYLNPNNFKNGKKGMLQFLRLDSYKGGITAGELNGYLNSLKPASSGTNVFYNQGQAFINAARKYNIDLSYLVGHSMLETGYGRSTLAQGQVLTSYKGKPLPHPVKVYNFFGIGAFDGTANLSGAEAAYKNGWTSVEKTIEGSARWISSNYIHHGSYGQNTLYKMRWSYDHLHHQYATDVNWANAISGIMYKFIGMYDTNSNLIFEIPVHR